jgi:hypothetical protein
MRDKEVEHMKIGYLFILAACAGLALESNSYSAGSWSDQPSWQNESPSLTGNEARVARRPARQSNYNLAPFAPGSNNVALDVGQVFLMGDLSTNYTDSIGSQLHYTYGVSDMFGFDSSFGYSNHSDGKYSMTTLLTGLRTNLAWYDKVVPYLVFGLGFYKPSYDIAAAGNAPAYSISPVMFGLHMGPGVDLELTKQLFFGASLTFHDMFGSTRTLASNQIMNVGGTFTSFYLHAGVTF